MRLSAPKTFATDTSSPREIAATVPNREGVQRSADLFGTRRELLIEHAGCVYRLRITQHNKLILTK